MPIVPSPPAPRHNNQKCPPGTKSLPGGNPGCQSLHQGPYGSSRPELLGPMGLFVTWGSWENASYDFQGLGGAQDTAFQDLWETQMLLVFGSLSEFSSLEPSTRLPAHPHVPRRQLEESKERLCFHSSPKSFALQGFFAQCYPSPVARRSRPTSSTLPAFRSRLRMFLSLLLLHQYLHLPHPGPGPSSLSRGPSSRLAASLVHPTPPSYPHYLPCLSTSLLPAPGPPHFQRPLATQGKQEPWARIRKAPGFRRGVWASCRWRRAGTRRARLLHPRSFPPGRGGRLTAGAPDTRWKGGPCQPSRPQSASSLCPASPGAPPPTGFWGSLESEAARPGVPLGVPASQ